MHTKIASHVSEIMTAAVVTVSPETSVAQIAEKLSLHRVGSVPVVDETDHVLGMVSEYDLLAKTGLTADDIMTTSVISVTAETDISDLRQLLVNQRIRRVPVLQGGRLVGIVSRGDIVALLITERVCGVCGESVRGEQPPERCPKCRSQSTEFALHEQPPGP